MRPHMEDHWLLYLARLHSVKGQRDAAGLWTNLNPEIHAKSVLLVIGPEAETGRKRTRLESL